MISVVAAARVSASPMPYAIRPTQPVSQREQAPVTAG
jgi:hypothetical protein